MVTCPLLFHHGEGLLILDAQCMLNRPEKISSFHSWNVTGIHEKLEFSYAVIFYVFAH